MCVWPDPSSPSEGAGPQTRQSWIDNFVTIQNSWVHVISFIHNLSFVTTEVPLLRDHLMVHEKWSFKRVVFPWEKISKSLFWNMFYISGFGLRLLTNNNHYYHRHQLGLKLRGGAHVSSLLCTAGRSIVEHNIIQFWGGGVCALPFWCLWLLCLFQNSKHNIMEPTMNPSYDTECKTSNGKQDERGTIMVSRVEMILMHHLYHFRTSTKIKKLWLF